MSWFSREPSGYIGLHSDTIGWKTHNHSTLRKEEVCLRIAIDAMGGDHAPESTVEGVVQAAAELPDAQLVLVGDEPRLSQLVKNRAAQVTPNIEIIHASEVITAEEEPVRAVRRKKESSMVVAVNAIKEKQADAVISAGNTGAFMTAGLLHAGRIEGIERPALAPLIPTIDGNGAVVLDVGANMDAKPVHLLHYAVMGSIYAETVLGKRNPRVGLLNVGTEEGKGNELTKAAFAELKQAPIHFVGNVEARDVSYGVCDVVVCDGFSGNILLKVMEGTASSIFQLLKQEFTRNLSSKLAAAILKPGLKRLKNKLDYAEYGGAPLLGLQGICIKAHGSSDARAIKNSVHQAKRFIDQNVIHHISDKIRKVSDQDGE